MTKSNSKKIRVFLSIHENFELLGDKNFTFKLKIISVNWTKPWRLTWRIMKQNSSKDLLSTFDNTYVHSHLWFRNFKKSWVTDYGDVFMSLSIAQRVKISWRLKLILMEQILGVGSQHLSQKVSWSLVLLFS